MGLQFSQECFCGNTYFSAEVDAVPSDACYMPCSGDEGEICGGPWANSVYIVGDPAELTEHEKEVGGGMKIQGKGQKERMMQEQKKPSHANVEKKGKKKRERNDNRADRVKSREERMKT